MKRKCFRKLSGVYHKIALFTIGTDLQICYTGHSLNYRQRIARRKSDENIIYTAWRSGL